MCERQKAGAIFFGIFSEKHAIYVAHVKVKRNFYREVQGQSLSLPYENLVTCLH